MTRGKQVILTLLSLVMIGLLVTGILWAQHFLLVVNPKSSHTNFKVEIKKETSVSSIEVAEKAVSLLEEKQSPETLKVAQEAVGKLDNSKNKKSLLARISVIKAKIKNKEILAEAERAVAYLEGHSDLSNISLAQDVVAKVTDPEVKKALEERIRTVQEALDNQERQQATSGSQPASQASVITPAPSETYTNNVPIQPVQPSAPVATNPVVEDPVLEPTLPSDPPPVNPEPIAPPFPNLDLPANE